MIHNAGIFFIGTSEFAVPSLKALVDLGFHPTVITKPDKPSGRSNKINSTPVKKAAAEMALDVWTPENLKDSITTMKIADKKPELIVTAAYGEYIPSDILKLPKLGCINVHPSLLPKYRGAAPAQRALMAGESQTGVTIAYVSKEWDSGDILSQASSAIAPEDNAGTLLKKLGEQGAALLKEVVPALFKGTLKGVPQDDRQATFAPKIQDEDLTMDWTLPAATIVNHIRGLSPEPGARTQFKNSPIKILEAKALSGSGNPGAVIRLEKEGPVVAAGAESSVLLLEIQPPNRNIMSGKDFVNGYRPQVGESFRA